MNERTEQSLPDAGLSHAGRQRRAAMRDALVEDMRAVHVARRMRRRIAAGASLMLAVFVLAGLAMIIARGSGPIGPTPPIAEAPRERELSVATAEESAEPDGAPPHSPRAFDTAIVQTRDGAADQYLVRTGPPKIESIDDAELIQLLAAHGHSAGIIRTNGEAWLILHKNERSDADDRDDDLLRILDPL